MIVVLDASAAAKLVLVEEGSNLVREQWEAPVGRVAPAIVVPEVAAAIASAVRTRRRGADVSAQAQQDWLRLVAEIELLSVDEPLALSAAALAATRAVLGMDALYLAVALLLVESAPVSLLSFDRRQRAALRAADGVALLPAELG